MKLGALEGQTGVGVAWYGPSTSLTMGVPIIRLGALLLAGAISACVTSGGIGMTGRGGSGFQSVSLPERIDACAGALIALRGAAEELRAELDETRGRKLVWREGRDHLRARNAPSGL